MQCKKKQARVMHDDVHDYYEAPNIQNMSAEIIKKIKIFNRFDYLQIISLFCHFVY